MASASNARRASASPGLPCSGTRQSNRVATNDSTRRVRLPRPSARSPLQPVANRAGVNRVSDASGAFAVSHQRHQSDGSSSSAASRKMPRARTRGEFSLAPGQPRKSLDAVHQTDIGARSQDRRGKCQRVECDIVLAEKLHEPRSRSGSPPVPPVSSGRGRRPFLGQRHIRNRRVEPDVEHLAIPAGLRHRHTPCEIACDAAIPQALVEQPPRQRQHQRIPIGLRVQPAAQLVGQL